MSREGENRTSKLLAIFGILHMGYARSRYRSNPWQPQAHQQVCDYLSVAFPPTIAPLLDASCTVIVQQMESRCCKRGDMRMQQFVLSTPPWVRKTLLVALASIITVANSGFSKPIWIDEFLHFAFGALTLSEVLSVIRETTGSGVNWGQTGAYFFANYVTGNLFGASLWALRLPSIFSGLALLAAAAWFIRGRGFGTFWQAFAIATVASQTTLMYYVGEARPYLPMAAAVTAVLAVFATPVQLQGHWMTRLLAWFGIVVGAVIHPYWLPFAGVIVVFVLWIQAGEQRPLRVSLRELPHIRLLYLGCAFYVVMARLTWANGAVTPVFDPLQFVVSVENAARTLASTHLTAIVSISPFLAVVVVASLAAFALRLEPRLRAPILLVAMGLTSSAALAGLSFFRSYWILQRQWVGGMALVALGLAWAAAELWSSPAPRRGSAQRILAATLMAAIGVGFISDLRLQLGAVWGHREAMARYQEDGESARELLKVDRDFVRAANVNAVKGGPVWRNHATYYGIEQGP